MRDACLMSDGDVTRTPSITAPSLRAQIPGGRSLLVYSHGFPSRVTVNTRARPSGADIVSVNRSRQLQPCHCLPRGVTMAMGIGRRRAARLLSCACVDPGRVAWSRSAACADVRGVCRRAHQRHITCKLSLRARLRCLLPGSHLFKWALCSGDAPYVQKPSDRASRSEVENRP